MNQHEYITVGKITNTHGNRGLLKVKPLTDFPERFFDMDDIIVMKEEDIRKTLTIQRVTSHKNFLIMQFEEIANMNEAEEYKGALLQVQREHLIELPEDTFYIFEIIGCKVFDRQGNYLGEVKDVIKTGANDVYVVEKKTRKKPLLIPAIKSVIYNVDLKQGRIDIDMIEGLDE